MNVLATFQNDPWKFIDVRVLTVIFRVRSCKMRKKIAKIFFWLIMKKTGIDIDYHLKPYLCTKFGDFSLKIESRNAKRGRLIKWSIMRIFNQAWECIVMKKNENILQEGTPKKIVGKKDTFGAFWCKLTIIRMILGDLKKWKSVKKLKTLMPV